MKQFMVRATFSFVFALLVKAFPWVLDQRCLDAYAELAWRGARRGGAGFQ